MNIEAVSVCVGYADFLAAVAPINRPLLDRWMIVTTPDDHETRQLCRQFSLECVLSDDHKRGGDFCKGRMIERGLAMLEGYEWMLHLDADIALPHDFHQVLEDAHLDESHIYGCDRLNVNGWDAWQRVLKQGLWCRRNAWGVELERPDTTLGMRVANRGTDGRQSGSSKFSMDKTPIIVVRQQNAIPSITDRRQEAMSNIPFNGTVANAR